ncbi:type II secretion system F family protein [Roseiflexus sp.]|uniref:type II secretion system F family protein n=1 Tax=Roseiflexus sp. TaxID=2562120 RepID=UPI0021DE99F0|nr:type II secretion system F family protein [Roseiflexus sp.]GIW03079.1 MAG: type II secretion system protein [Roseiflexus sp.]
MLIIPSIVTALAILLVVAGLMASRRDVTVGERLDAYLSPTVEKAPSNPSLEAKQPFSERVIIPLLKRASRAFAWIMPQNRYEALRLRLAMAGYPWGLTAADFVGAKGIVCVLVGLLTGVIGWAADAAPTFFNILLLGGIALCAFFLPDVWLSRRIGQRQTELLNALPDALDLLAIATAAGLSFENAIQEITSKWTNELAREFSRVLRDMSMGVPRRQALTDMAERTGVPDIASFVSAIKQAEALGVSIGRVLAVQAEEMRTRRRQRAQERANQAPVKMMFPLVFLIFPAIFAVLLGPAVPQLLEAFGGI